MKNTLILMLVFGSLVGFGIISDKLVPIYEELKFPVIEDEVEVEKYDNIVVIDASFGDGVGVGVGAAQVTCLLLEQFKNLANGRRIYVTLSNEMKIKAIKTFICFGKGGEALIFKVELRHRYGYSVHKIDARKAIFGPVGWKLR